MRLRITYFDQNESFADQLPREGVVVARPRAGDSPHDWYLLRLDDPVVHRNERYGYVLVASRWAGYPVDGSEPTLVFVLLVPGSEPVVRDGFAREQFELVVWGMSSVVRAGRIDVESGPIAAQGVLVGDAPEGGRHRALRAFNRQGDLVITQSDVMPLLLEACPGFEPTWREHRDSWDGEEPGIYNDTGAFAEYLVACCARGETSEFERAFATIERLVCEGDEAARDAAVFGVLESVQTRSTHESFGPEAFVGWLGPLSRRAWSEIDELWRANGGSLAGVVRAEVGAARGLEPLRRWWQFRKR